MKITLLCLLILQIFFATRAARKLEDIQSRDTLETTAREQKYLMDYNKILKRD